MQHRLAAPTVTGTVPRPAVPGAGHPSHPGHPGQGIGPVGSVRPDNYVFSRSPMLVYWETTVACGLACKHCRAFAMPTAGEGELSTEEGLRLLDQITGFGQPYPHIVFTGGDPLRRTDLFTLIEAARERGIGASLAPASTPDLTYDGLVALKEAGIQTISLSLDGSSADLHDTFRGVPGTFDHTVRAAGWAHELGIPLQVNTLVTDTTLADLPAIYDLMVEMKIMRWSLFFLITMGRGKGMQEVTPGESEKLMHWVYNLSKTAPFAIKTTEATHYRRVASKQLHREGVDDATIASMPVGRGFGVRDGNGIIFVSHKGEVNPSGFLPVDVGNVRTENIVDLYRNHPVFVSLRDVDSFKGRCGRCRFAQTCGGSRARAYAWTGDYLESDPLCPYVPHESRIRES